MQALETVFLEFAGADDDGVAAVFERLQVPELTSTYEGLRGFLVGDTRFLVNATPRSGAQTYADLHGPSLTGIGVRVVDAKRAWLRALEMGLKPPTGSTQQVLLGSAFPHSVVVMGGVTMYLLDEQEQRWLEHGFSLATPSSRVGPSPFSAIDHITFNVHAGQREYWKRAFAQFLELRCVYEADLRVGQSSSLTSVLQSENNRVSLACNEPATPDSPLHEQMARFKGEGMQHLAFLTDDVLAAHATLRSAGIATLKLESETESIAPEALHELLPGADPKDFIARDIQVATSPTASCATLQLFSEPVLGPSFLEFIQRVNLPQGFITAAAQGLLKTLARRQHS